MGDFLLMTNEGTFVINGTERVVSSWSVPGAYFERTPDKTTARISTSAIVHHAVPGWSWKLTVETKFQFVWTVAVSNQ